MTTQDKNAEIAKWMGYNEHMSDKDLKYHSDWNWLMGATIMCFKRYDEVIDNSVFSADNQQFKLNDALLETNIKSLHEAVYQFVVWHNAQVNQTKKH